LNEPWTIVPDTATLGAPDVLSGIAIAAAGNIPGKEENADMEKPVFPHFPLIGPAILNHGIC
jgi:hypothetical protein